MGKRIRNGKGDVKQEREEETGGVGGRKREMLRKNIVFDLMISAVRANLP